MDSVGAGKTLGQMQSRINVNTQEIVEFDEKNYPEAINYLEQAADRGNVSAMLKLMNWYAAGELCGEKNVVNITKAVKYCKAIEEATSMVPVNMEILQMCLDGSVFEIDFHFSINYLENLAILSNSQKKIADIFLKSEIKKEVIKNCNGILCRVFKQAALPKTQSITDTQERIKEDEVLLKAQEYLTKYEYEDAIKIFISLVDSLHSEMAFKQCILVLSEKLSIFDVLKGCETMYLQGSPAAAYFLGEMYELGIAAQQDLSKACDYYKDAYNLREKLALEENQKPL
jgi:TPR repeat protein